MDAGMALPTLVYLLQDRDANYRKWCARMLEVLAKVADGEEPDVVTEDLARLLLDILDHQDPDTFTETEEDKLFYKRCEEILREMAKNSEPERKLIAFLGARAEQVKHAAQLIS